MLQPDRLSVYQACPSRPPSRILKSLCPLLRTMITYKKVQVLYHSETGLSNYRRVMFVETRKLPGRQLSLSDGEGSEGQEEEDEEYAEQHQGCTISIGKMIIPMSQFPLLFDRFLFHDAPHLPLRTIMLTHTIRNIANKKSATVIKFFLL